MQVGIVAVVAVLVVAGLLCYGFRWRSRSLLFQDREPKSLETIYAESGTSASFEIFSGLFSTFAEGLSVDARLLRPDDRLKDFFAIDSWEIGAGEDALNLWLSRWADEVPDTVRTLRDLAEWASRAGTVPIQPEGQG